MLKSDQPQTPGSSDSPSDERADSARPRSGPLVATVLSTILVKARWLLLTMAVILTVLGLEPASRLVMDAAIESLFADSDPVLESYLESISTFGGDEVVVIAYRDPDLLTVEGLERVERFANQLVAADLEMVENGELTAPSIRGVMHIARLPMPSVPLGGPIQKYLKKHPIPKDKLATELLSSEMFHNMVIGSDAETTAIVVTLVSDTERGVRQQTTAITAIKDLAKNLLIKEGLSPQIAGGPVMVHDAVKYLDEDGTIFLFLTTSLLVLILAILFRSLRWIVIPLAVVHFSLIWTEALLVVFNSQLTMISSVLTALVTVIGIATVIHATVRFREERESCDAFESLRRTLVHVGPPCFWTSVTTAVGFAALMISKISPVRNFGLMMALGAFLVWCVAACILPGIAVAPGLGRGPQKPPGEKFLARQLERILNMVVRHPLIVTTCLLLVIGTLTSGIPRLQVETDFSRNFRSTAPVREALRFIEDGLSGAGNFEVSFPVPENIERKDIEFLRELESELRQVPGVTKVLGLADAIDFAEKRNIKPAIKPTGISGLIGQLIKTMSTKMQLDTLRRSEPTLLAGFWNEKTNRMRIMLRASEQAPSAAKERLIKDVRQVTSEVFQRSRANAITARRLEIEVLAARATAIIPIGASPFQPGPSIAHVWLPWSSAFAHAYQDKSSGLSNVAARIANDSIPEIGPDQIHVTGYYVLLSHLVEQMLYDQWTTFSAAGAGCFLMISLAFWNWRFGVIALVPNAFPILMVIGAMGWFGDLFPINMATAMLASVAIGMAVDSSIHYIYHFREEIRGGADFDIALSRTHQSVGQALVFANLAIVIGFLALTASNFIPTIHFGILTAIALTGGLAGNLFVLPLLLGWVRGKRI